MFAADGLLKRRTKRQLFLLGTLFVGGLALHQHYQDGKGRNRGEYPNGHKRKFYEPHGNLSKKYGKTARRSRKRIVDSRRGRKRQKMRHPLGHSPDFGSQFPLPEYNYGNDVGMMAENGQFRSFANAHGPEPVNKNQQLPPFDANGLASQQAANVNPPDNTQQQQQQSPGILGSAYNTVGRGVAATANFSRPFVNQVGPQVVKTVVPGFSTAIASSLGPFGSVAGGIIG